MIEKVKYMIYGVFTYLSLDTEMFAVLITLMVFDSVVGAVKSLRLGEVFSFKIMLWGISMKLIFLMIPITLALMAKNLGYDFTMAVNVVMSILTVSESYSIFGNIYMAKNKVRIDRVDLVSALLITLRRTMKNLAEKLIQKVEEK
jgi:glucan phosphoethanolaminetransferase (alkaline phosphatase superfamily)